MYSVPSPPPTWNPSPQSSLLGRTTTTTTPPPTSPTSPTTRSGRLRGLSYLRSYTQNHLLSRDSHSNSNGQQRPSTLARATSYPSPNSPTSSANRGSAAASPASQDIVARQTSPTAQRSTAELTTANPSNAETSGWLPTVGGHSVASRIASEPQSTATASSSAVLASNASGTGASGLTNSMARTRSATVSGATDMPQVDGGDSRARNEAPSQANANGNGANGMNHQLPSIRFTAHQDPRAQRPSLVFSPMARILPTGKEIIKVGRYSERDNQPAQAANVPSAAPVGFKSKVVSRRHCEFWCTGGRWFIKDVKSSSGTFLNHIRLSSPGTESRPFPVNDGDIVQLGIDFKGGEEMIFRCVKIRVELNKGWQNGPSSFNVQSHKRLRELNNLGKPPTSGSSQDCSICLGPIAPCQSLFVAPCSHTWHYKCIRVIINGPHWPHFICPNCRTVADLEAELDDPFADGEWEELEVAEAAEDREARETTAAPEETPAASRPARQANSSEATQAPVPPPKDDSDQEQSVPSDAEVAEASDASEPDHGVHEVATSMGYLNVEDPPSPPSSSSSQPHVSNATVQPVDIIGRKPVPNGTSSHLGEPSTHNERGLTRTPSPNGLHPSSMDAVTGVEGPMTPRNDAGPFIFDGSAGRAAGMRLANVANMNLDEAADTPIPSATPQPQATAEP